MPGLSADDSVDLQKAYLLLERNGRIACFLAENSILGDL
jgi:hypothetical protein